MSPNGHSCSRKGRNSCKKMEITLIIVSTLTFVIGTTNFEETKRVRREFRLTDAGVDSTVEGHILETVDGFKPDHNGKWLCGKQCMKTDGCEAFSFSGEGQCTLLSRKPEDISVEELRTEVGTETWSASCPDDIHTGVHCNVTRQGNQNNEATVSSVSTTTTAQTVPDLEFEKGYDFCKSFSKEWRYEMEGEVCVSDQDSVKTYTEAEELCNRYNGVLAYIPDQATRSEIFKRLEFEHISLNLNAWLSLYQEETASSPHDGWYWVDHLGQKIPANVSSEWGPGQPDGGQGQGALNKKHAVMGKNGVLFVTDAGDRHPVICQHGKHW